MCFVVYFIAADTHIVIPNHWIYQHQIAVEKFINYALNTNQTFLCFFADNVSNDQMLEHLPNFHAPRIVEYPFSGSEGCFEANMVKFFCKCILQKIRSHFVMNILTDFFDFCSIYSETQ